MNPEYFSISEGGIFHSALAKLRLDKNPVKLILVFLSITWLPLFIFTAIDGTLYAGVPIPFLKDIAMQMRLLITLPLLLVIGRVIDNNLTDLQKYFSDTLMNDPEQQLHLNRELKRVNKMAYPPVIELILLLIIIVITINIGKGGLWNDFHNENDSWKSILNDGIHVHSIAGNWVNYVSIPVFQFLLIRWIWRYIIWLYFLYRLSRNRLNLQSTHPDKAGGLGIILHIQKYFCLFFIAINIVVSGELIAKLLIDPDSFHSIRSEAIGYIVICLLLLILPLFFYTGKLIKTKHEGLMNLGKLGTDLSNKFENEWVNNTVIETKLIKSTVTTSTLQDYSTIYNSLQQLRSIPISIRDILMIIILLFIPYLPVLFIHFSFGELLQKLIGLLL